MRHETPELTRRGTAPTIVIRAPPRLGLRSRRFHEASRAGLGVWILGQRKTRYPVGIAGYYLGAGTGFGRYLTPALAFLA